MRSSFLGCEHLETLSSQLAISSASRYGEKEDKYEIDYSNNAQNVVDLLQKMKFEDVSTNKYYTLEKEEDSSAVAVGYKEIKTSENNYTLLAVVPRSAGYKQEWVGDFNVGNSGIHEGFKLARDEILRYLKKYIQDNNIKGNLKIWTVGHSRGAAVANMLGAFFAGGGIEYFGDSVSLTPEDVYCYTYATPTTIIAGIDKNIELSVGGYRGGEEYLNDTKGDPFLYTKGGQVDPKDKIYGGIRNFISPYDFITKLPIESWGYTRYGTDISVDHDGKVAESVMVNKLKETSLYAYNKYVNKCGPSLFEGKTFDIKTLEIVKDNNNKIGLNDFVKARIDGLAHKANTLEVYNNGYQDGLKDTAGIYGMALVFFDEIDINEDIDDKDNLIYSILFTYLAYASDCLQEEGRAQNDTDAFKIAIEELLEFATDKEVNDNTTIDEIVESILRCACESKNEILLDKLVSLIIEKVPKEYHGIFKNVIGQYHKDYDKEEEIDAKEILKEFFKACVYGADENAPIYSTNPTAKEARNNLYQIVSFALTFLVPDGGYTLASTMFMDENGNCTGAGTISNLIDTIYPMLMKVKDKDGNIIKTCEDFNEAADYRLVNLIDELFDDIIDKSKEKFGEKFQEDLKRHVENAKENISSIREAFTYFFLYDKEGFNTEKIIGNITTFISNPEVITLPHFNELYIAYAKAAQTVDCGYENHIEKDKTEETEVVETNVDGEKADEANTDEIKENNAETNTISDNPKTGDNIAIWIIVLVIGIVGMIGTILFVLNLKKRDKSRK